MSIFCFLCKTFKKLKNLSFQEHLAITDAFKANLSRGKSLYVNTILPVSIHIFLILEILHYETWQCPHVKEANSTILIDASLSPFFS